ncbi:MAG: accessory factor UbiK family protein [Alphaproteobacteria bacterium]
MQTRNRIFDDAAKLAGGAVGTLEGVRREVETLVRQQVERMLSKFDLVTRDEFDAVKEMAARARAEQEELAKRLERLEAARVESTPAKKTSVRKTPKAKKT